MNITNSTTGSNRGRAILWILSAIAGMGILVLIAMKTGFREFLDNLQLISPWVLIPLVLVYSISWLFRGLRLKQILHLTGVDAGLFKSLGIELLADLPNQLVPAKLGDSVKVIYLHRSGMMDYRKGTFTAFIVRVMDLAAVIILALVSAVFVSRSVAGGHILYLLAISLLMIILVLTGWIFTFRPALFRKFLFGPLRGLRDSACELAGQLRAAPGRLLSIFTVSILVWIFDILTLLIFLLVLGIKLSFAETAFVMLLSTVAKIVPLTPNGLGLYEGMMVVLLAGFGINESTAFTVAVLDHGFMNIFSMLLSLIAVYSMGLGLKGAGRLLRKSRERQRD
jgi:glycosyltransferase AglD